MVLGTDLDYRTKFRKYILDAEHILDTYVAVTTTATGEVIDLGNDYVEGAVVVAGNFEFVTGDETYTFTVNLSDDSSGDGLGFQGGDVIIAKSTFLVGTGGFVLGALGASYSAQVDHPMNNRIGLAGIARFMRVDYAGAGTTPICSGEAFFSKDRVGMA